MFTIKRCPVCGAQITLDMVSAKMCFACGAELTMPITPEEMAALEKESQELAKQEAERHDQQKQELQKNTDLLASGKRRLLNSQQNSQYRYLAINDVFEYDVVSVPDIKGGCADVDQLKSVIQSRAQEGWRLIHVTTNRTGTTISTAGFDGFFSGTSVDMDQTILFFERCIQRYNYEPVTDQDKEQ